MKALNILASVAATFAIAGTVFYLGWMRAPSADEVCGNVARIARKESGLELPPQAHDECLRGARPPEFGRVPWVRRMKCMARAETETDLEACARSG